MTDYKRSIVVEIDGTGAVVGARKVQASLNDIDRATKNVDGGMRRVGDASRSATSSMHGLGTAAKAAMAYFSVSTMAQFGKAVLDAGVAMDSLQRSFVAISGSQGGAASQLAFLRQEADRLGQNFFTLAPAFKNISAAATGTALEGQGVREVFSSIVEASTALGMSNADTEGALRALAQMMSKGTVQAEELRGQLSERLPGAFQIMARALGKTTPELNKMLEQGEVLSDVALPALAKEITRMYGAAAQTAALESGQAATNKMSEAWTDFKTNLYDSDQAVQGINAITSAIKTLTEYAGLRSISETFAEGAKMAQEGKLNWEEFKKASYMDRQRMVDSGGMMGTFRGKVNRGDVRSVLPSVAASAVAPIKKSKADKSAESAMARMQEEIARLTLSAADFEHYQIDQEFAKIAQEIGAANPLLAQWVALRREEAELTRGKEVDKELADFFGDIDKQSAELIEKAKATNERNEEILLDFSDRYREIVVGETEFKKEQIDRQAEIFRKAGADEIAVAQWVAQEKLAISRDWQDGAKRALLAYADEGSNAAMAVESVMTTAFQGMEDVIVDFVKTGKLEFADLVTSINAEIARLAFKDMAGQMYSFLGDALGGGKSSSGGSNWLGTALNMGMSALGSYFGGGSSVAAGSAGGGFNYAGEMSSFFSRNAKGGVYDSPSLSAYSGGVYSSPQLFAFAKGAGVFGEAGPEAIMPLKRGPDGVLGVQAGGGNSEMTALLREIASGIKAQRGTKVVNAIGKGAIANELSGSEGEQVIFNHIRRNPQAIRRMLGL